MGAHRGTCAWVEGGAPSAAAHSPRPRPPRLLAPQDAQNAAATLALLELCGGDAPDQHPPLWAQLPPVFRDLWLQWEEEGEAAASAGAESPEEAAAREAFVAGLVQREAAVAASTAAAGADPGGAAAAAAAGPGSWQERLAGAIRAAEERGGEPGRQQGEQGEGRRLAEEWRRWRDSPEGAKWLEARAQ